MSAPAVEAAVDVDYVGAAPDVIAAMREVYAATGGQDFAYALVAAARDRNSPLHRCFDWDDREAAERWRVDQAERLIRRVRVTVVPADQGPPVRVRAFVAARDTGAEAGGAVHRYTAVQDVAADDAARAALLTSIQWDLDRLRRKYAAVQGFADIVRDLLE